MRTQTAWFRLGSAIAIAPLLLAPLPAAAQTGPAPGPSQPFASLNAGDPPARVGRLARLRGTVSFHTADQTQWEAAVLNYPVTAGNAFWTEPGATAELEVGAIHVVLDQSSEFDIDTLDDARMTATLAQGSIYLRIPNLAGEGSIEIRTPRGVVAITAPGRYELTAGDTDHPTSLTVVDGAARVTGGSVDIAAGPHQTIRITGNDSFQAEAIAELDDAFLAARLAEERPAPARRAVAPPPVVAQMTGGDALAEIGEWEPSPQYGQVWYPPVETGWVPYRHGHWAYVSPWGWTWVDEAAWGFAPFHYGRWVQTGPRWGWIAGEPGARYDDYRPVYSPALVSFVGIGAGVALGLAAGAAVGWIPLGPREPYYPTYRTSPSYFRRMNVTNVNNVANLPNMAPQNRNFANRAFATVVPASAMAGSQPVAQRAQAVDPRRIASLQAVQAPAVRPTFATAGVTPGVARQLNLATPPGALPNRPAAPGPSLQQRPPGNAQFRTPGLPGSTPAALGGNPNNPINPGVPTPGSPFGQRPGPGGPLAPNPNAALPNQPGGLRQPSGAPVPPARLGNPAGPFASPRGPGAPGPAIQPRNPAGPPVGQVGLSPGAVPNAAGAVPSSPAPLPGLRPPGANPRGPGGAPVPNNPGLGNPGPGNINPGPNNRGPNNPAFTNPGAANPGGIGPRPLAPAPFSPGPATQSAPPGRLPPAAAPDAAPRFMPPQRPAGAVLAPQVAAPIRPAPQIQVPPPAMRPPQPQAIQPAPAMRQPPPQQAAPMMRQPPPAAPVMRQAPPPPVVHAAPPPPAPVARPAPPPPQQVHAPPPPQAQHAPPPAGGRSCPPGRPSC